MVELTGKQSQLLRLLNNKNGFLRKPKTLFYFVNLSRINNYLVY